MFFPTINTYKNLSLFRLYKYVFLIMKTSKQFVFLYNRVYFCRLNNRVILWKGHTNLTIKRGSVLTALEKECLPRLEEGFYPGGANGGESPSPYRVECFLGPLLEYSIGLFFLFCGWQLSCICSSCPPFLVHSAGFLRLALIMLFGL